MIFCTLTNFIRFEISKILAKHNIQIDDGLVEEVTDKILQTNPFFLICFHQQISEFKRINNVEYL